MENTERVEWYTLIDIAMAIRGISLWLAYHARGFNQMTTTTEKNFCSTARLHTHLQAVEI